MNIQYTVFCTISKSLFKRNQICDIDRVSSFVRRVRIYPLYTEAHVQMILQLIRFKIDCQVLHKLVGYMSVRVSAVIKAKCCTELEKEYKIEAKRKGAHNFA